MVELRHSLGSMLVCGYNGTDLPNEFQALLRDGCLGGIILFARNYRDFGKLSELTTQIHSSAPNPVLIAVDQEGGRVARFAGDFPVYPSPRYYGLRQDSDGLLFATRRTAEYLVRAGVNLNLLPVCDLAPAGMAHVIYSRSYSAVPSEVAEVVGRQVECLREAGVVSCAKHFPGLASAYGDPHIVVSKSDQRLGEFRQRDYVPFRSAIDAGVDMIMMTHLLARQVDPDHIATFSAIFIEQELRAHLGFTGLVISDDLLMAGALEGISPAEAGIRAIMAGCDLLIYGDLSDNISQVLVAILTAAASDPALAERVLESGERVARFRGQRLTSGGVTPDKTQNPD